MSTTDPRAALTALIDALERHYTAAVDPSGQDDPALDRANDRLAEAFDIYDGALFDAVGTATPLVVFDDEDDFDDFDDDFEDDDDDDYEDDEDDDLDEDFEDFDDLDDDEFDDDADDADDDDEDDSRH